MGSYTHTFSAASVLHVQGGRTYEARPQTWRYNNLPSDIDAKAGFPTQFDTGFLTLGNIIPGVNITGLINETGEDNNSEVTANSWSVKSDFIHVIGKHTFKLGGEYNGIGETQSIEWAQLAYSSAETAINSNDSKTGNGVASFVLGIPNHFTKRNLAESISPGGFMGYYLQDQWQMSPKLTVNLGIRYDLALIPEYGTPEKTTRTSATSTSTAEPMSSTRFPAPAPARATRPAFLQRTVRCRPMSSPAPMARSSRTSTTTSSHALAPPTA